MALGPAEWIAIGFPGSKLNGSIAPALQKLVASGTIRIIDLIVVHKDSAGTVTTLELEGLDPDEAAPFDDLDGDVLGLLSEADIALASEALEPNSAAALLVWEDTWATAFAEAVREADGWVVAHDRIPGEAVRAALEAASAEGGQA
jgi:hypothetical protein